MAIYNATYLEEKFFNIFKKKEKKEGRSKKADKKNKEYPNKFTRIDVTTPSESIFNKLYNNEALTAEGVKIEEGTLEMLNKWFRENSDCTARDVDFYVIKGKVMNNFYKLTDDNAYPNDFTIVCIDWFPVCTSPYKGVWRWFSDVVDNNAKREIAKKNPHYEHFESIYYGPIGWGD